MEEYVTPLHDKLMTEPIWQDKSDPSVVYDLYRRRNTLRRVFNFYCELHHDFKHFQGSAVAFQYESVRDALDKRAARKQKLAGAGGGGGGGGGAGGGRRCRTRRGV